MNGQDLRHAVAVEVVDELGGVDRHQVGLNDVVLELPQRLPGLAAQREEELENKSVLCYALSSLLCSAICAYARSSSGDAVRRAVLVQILLAREGEDLVLGPPGPNDLAGAAVQSHDPAEARLLTGKVDITDEIRNIVPIGSCDIKIYFLKLN